MCSPPPKERGATAARNLKDTWGRFLGSLRPRPRQRWGAEVRPSPCILGFRGLEQELPSRSLVLMSENLHDLIVSHTLSMPQHDTSRKDPLVESAEGHE